MSGRAATLLQNAPRPVEHGPRLTVEYGHALADPRQGPYRVEFALTDRGGLIGRYLEPETPWEMRDRDAANALVLDAITALLRAYASEEQDPDRDPHEEAPE